jgi:hypothetical protein
MSADIIKLPCNTTRAGRRAARRATSAPNMHTLLFRSYDLIVESDDADLARDVAFDVDKAATKQRKVRERLQGVREQAAPQIEMLTKAETKLAAAIVAALLARQK